MKRIMVTGAGGPAGINFVISLRIAPEKMFVVGTEANPHFVYLAPTDKKYLVPKATEHLYIDKLNELIEKEKIEFLHPQPDIEVQVTSENREKLKAKTFLPSKKAVKACQDKLESAQIWQNKGIPVARTMALFKEQDIEEAFQELGNPIWIRARHGAGGRGSTPANNKETAISWINYWKSRNVNWEFIAQEHLPGRNIGFHSLWKNGELVTSMARERIEYIYPYLAPSGITGTPAVQKTVHDKEVNRIGTEAVLAIDPNFTGIACVDLKENKYGVPCATEINAGRMFTTSFFFSYASKILRKDYYANIPYLYVKLAYDERIPEIPKYDVLPENTYWIRHIDAPAKLVRNGKIIGEMYR
ncbi:MAG: ATP-grasp domain-containing protein [Candidatus Bathyarchaeota archaeon]|jgi:carbamoyl-phosphate synthase large subunit|nr:ATP-grasp domain-containing protein [Candidatus Bathyarchaeota archaeon A05DMB-5]MDH7557148.1 ATP-grasp domain-containing protein [Candidatus Bathyarchaeota archaeon]